MDSGEGMLSMPGGGALTTAGITVPGGLAGMLSMPAVAGGALTVGCGQALGCAGLLLAAGGGDPRPGGLFCSGVAGAAFAILQEAMPLSGLIRKPKKAASGKLEHAVRAGYNVKAVASSSPRSVSKA